MKLIIFLSIGFCIQVSAHALAQSITLSEKDASFKTVLQSIQRQSGYSFMIINDLMEQAHPVTIHVKSEDIEKVLPIFFNGQPFTYEVSGKLIKVLPNGNPNVMAIPLGSIQQTIRGRVTDSLGSPLEGVTVQVKESGRQTITDRDGRYTIAGVYPTETLHFRLLSYVPFEIQANRQEINIMLKLFYSFLDEPIVIGYGTTSRRLSTGSVGKVSAREIHQQPVSNPLQALRGRVPGVFVQSTAGEPGSGVLVQIRGKNSIAAGNEPLYIIDGIPFDSEQLNQLGGNLSVFNSINPLDIESIEILKDADATAIYGSRGANGVILISTKKGTAGKTAFNLDYYQGYSKVGNTISMMNTEEYFSLRKMAFKNDGIIPNQANAPDLLLWDSTTVTFSIRSLM